MGDETQRVVAGFDDPHDADEARSRLEAEHPGASVEENAPADTGVAFGPPAGRGDSTERQPDTTVAVEVPADRVGDELAELAREGAEAEAVDPPAPR